MWTVSAPAWRHCRAISARPSPLRVWYCHPGRAGPARMSDYVEAKLLEWSDYCKQVTQWELDRYLTVY